MSKYETKDPVKILQFYQSAVQPYLLHNGQTFYFEQQKIKKF